MDNYHITKDGDKWKLQKEIPGPVKRQMPKQK